MISFIMFFFFKDTATTEIYTYLHTLSLHDALALVVINFADLVFAVDSVPAIFAITTDMFIVYTSNVMAILGLRALYFALPALVPRFHYLQHAPDRKSAE